MPLPSGWLDYTPIGKQIRGTRFICFKVPLTLDDEVLSNIRLSDQLTPEQLIKRVKNLGLIIDLTDTSKYYSPLLFLKHGIEYAKIRIEGKLLPQQHQHDEFANVVKSFLSRNKTKLIGVHCTHGCNRTGLLVCTFLVEHCRFSASEALSEFSLARGHPIERQNYLQSIKRRVSVKRMQTTAEASSMTPIPPSNNWRQSLNFRLNQTDVTRNAPRSNKTDFKRKPDAQANRPPPEMAWTNFAGRNSLEANQQIQHSENEPLPAPTMLQCLNSDLKNKIGGTNHSITSHNLGGHPGAIKKSNNENFMNLMPSWAN